MRRPSPRHVPRRRTANYRRDGQTRFDGNSGSTVNYQPNSFDGPVDDPRMKEPPLKISGDADSYNHRDGNEDYSQAGALYRLMSEAQKVQLVGNLVDALNAVPLSIQLRQIIHFHKADPDYGSRVAQGLGINVKDFRHS